MGVTNLTVHTHTNTHMSASVFCHPTPKSYVYTHTESYIEREQVWTCGFAYMIRKQISLGQFDAAIAASSKIPVCRRIYYYEFDTHSAELAQLNYAL